MIYHQHSKSKTLQVWESLNNRMALLPGQKKTYVYRSSGDKGEIVLVDTANSLPDSCLVLHDLWLRFGSTAIQIDTVIIAGRMLYLYEVKNYSGTFYYKSQQLFLNQSEEEIVSPLHQIAKNRVLLEKFLQQHGFPFQVAPYVVFTNPDFHMYQSPRDQPFLFRNQLERHMQQVALEGETYSHFAKQHRLLAEKLLDLRYEEEVRYESLPTYTFDSLRKGVSCRQCHSFLLQNDRNSCTCLECGCKEKIVEAIERTIIEFKLLFPQEKVTKKSIYYWCGKVYSEQRILRVLQQNYKLKGVGKAAYYL